MPRLSASPQLLPRLRRSGDGGQVRRAGGLVLVGDGTRTYYEANCQRSVTAYPYLLHNAHPSWTFVNAACSGAKTGDVLNSQVSSVTSDTNWVTYTIGGNDAGFSSVITECALPSWASNCNGAIDTAQTTSTTPCRGGSTVNNAIKSRRRARKWSCSTTRGCSTARTATPARGSAPEETRLNQTADLLHDKISAAATGRGRTSSSGT